MNLMNHILSIDIDAFGKPGEGILEGNLWWMGSYGQCVRMDEAHFCSMKNVVLMEGNKEVSNAVLHHILID